MTPPTLTDTSEGARFLVRVTPRARKTAILGVAEDGRESVLRIALQAPPLEGRANAALIEFLADLLSVPRSALEIASGAHARNKLILVRGRSAADVSARLDEAQRVHR